MAKSQTSIKPAIHARLSSFTTATFGPEEVTIIHRGHAMTVTRREFEKAKEADERFLRALESLNAATDRAMGEAA